MNKTKRGFTLFELLVSISIVGILTVLAIVSFSSAQKKARDARRLQDMQLISKAAEQYYMVASSVYPTTFGTGTSWSFGGQTVLETIPLDPKGVGYSTPSTLTATGYCICAYIEGGNGNSTDQNCSYNAVGTKSWYCVKNQQ
jgi:prepilin-type N-terminal cleavage/methylation domain-containing protein